MVYPHCLDIKFYKYKKLLNLFRPKLINIVMSEWIKIKNTWKNLSMYISIFRGAPFERPYICLDILGWLIKSILLQQPFQLYNVNRIFYIFETFCSLLKENKVLF